MTCDLNTDEYEFSHGRKPRGTGYWAFEMTFTDGNGSFATETRFASGTLSAARKMAWQQLKSECGRAKSLVSVNVLP